MSDSNQLFEIKRIAIEKYKDQYCKETNRIESYIKESSFWKFKIYA